MKIKSLIFTAVLATAFLCFGAGAFAQTGTQSMINTLMQQIAQLQAQLQVLLAQQQGGTEWCHTFNANIGMGQKTGNPEVDALVTALQKEGLIDQGATFEGYDEDIASAVTGFQEKYASEILTPYNLKHGTGYVGKATRAKLNTLYGCAPQAQCKTDADCPQPTCATQVGGVAPTCAGNPIKCVDGKCVSTPTNLPPVISGVSGPTTLNVNQTGTWTISASDPENGTLSYSVIWGDEPAAPSMIAESAGAGGFLQTATFTHAYAGPGLWTPIFYVKDNLGSKAKTSISVSVGDGTQPSITVISPNGGETWQIGGTYSIKYSVKNIPATDGLLIYLEKGYEAGSTKTGVNSSLLIASTTNMEVFNYTVPGSIATWPGLGSNYTIKVCQMSNCTNVFDSSNNYFSIVSSAQPGGPLYVSLDASSPVSQNLTPGQTNFTFAKIKLTNGTNTAINNMNGIQVGSNTGGDYLANIKVYDGSTQLGSTLSGLVDNGSYYYGWDYISGFSIPAYATKVLTLVADVKSTAPGSSANLGVTGLNFDSPGCTISGTPVYGRNMTIISSTSPSVKITSPAANSTLTSKNVKVSGTCSNYNGAMRVYYYSNQKEETLTQCINGAWSTDIYIISNAGSGSFDLYAETYDGTAQDKIKLYFNWSGAPSITATYPNGGETFKVGSTYTVKWNTSGFNSSDPFRVALITKPSSTGSFSEWTLANVSNTGSYNWTVPPTLQGEGTIPIEGNGIYKIRIYYLGTNIAYDDSDNYFSITSSAQPSITVTSPNGGEVWKIGEARNITWTSTGLSADAKIIIYLSDSSYNYSFASGIPASQGSYNWTVPATIGPFNTSAIGSGWKIMVNTLQPETIVIDTSNNYFSIISSVQPSITISGSSGSQTNSSSLTVNIGNTFTISGIPQNLQGLSYYFGTGYPPSGYYNRAYFFDQTFGNNNSCGNNEASTTGPWTMTCTAKVAGSSYFYIEIYANGQVYKSNTVNVTIPSAGTCTDTDGGVNYFIKGTATGIYGSCADSCITQSNGQVWIHECNCSANGPWSESTAIACASGYSCQDGACVQTVQPSITVTSPNGGESWTQGQVKNISWSSNGLLSSDRIDIWLYHYDANGLKDGQSMIAAVAGSATFSPWIVSGISGLTPSNYKILLQVYRDTVHDIVLTNGTSANYFSIVPAQITCTDTDGGKSYDVKGTTTNSNGDSLTDYCVSGYSSYNLMEGYCGPNGEVANEGHLCSGTCISGACSSQPAPTITITSPVGGETWQKQSTYNITWTSTGVDRVNIVTGSFGAVQIGMNVSASSGTYSWTIPSTVAPGSYAITMYDVNNASSVVATSQRINIVEPTTASLNSLSAQLAAMAQALTNLFGR